MAPQTREVARDYAENLGRHLADPGEDSLSSAYDIGRAALSSGIGILDIVTAHREALGGFTSAAASKEEVVAMGRAAMSFLLETLGPFEMALGGFLEANDNLKAMNTHLEDLVDQRTVELRTSVDDLRRLDEQRRRLLHQLTRAQEDERRVIANAFHDDAIQVMTAVAMRIGSLRMRADDPELLELLRPLEETLREAITRSRRFLFELRPPSLDRAGLGAAARELVDHFAEGTDVACSFTDELEADPRPEIRALAFRVLQEALRNVRKHARARHVGVELRRDGEGVLLRVEDDGKGFDVSTGSESPPGHLGLTAMRERAELAGGWFRVTTEPGAGTTVEAWFPSDRQAAAHPV
jgi:signal transduction histidine kinase